MLIYRVLIIISSELNMQYQGQIVDGQMHGNGKLTYENGEFYDGDWVRGAKSSFFL